MMLHRWLGAALVITLLGGGYRVWGWQGVALVGGGLVMWGLLHVTRMLTVMRRASQRPVGWTDSAVMLNAKLRPKLSLLHVLALTKALGERLSGEQVDPEVYRWTDGSGSSVTCTFATGRLQSWELARPAP